MRRTCAALFTAVLTIGGFVQPIGAAVRTVEAAVPPPLVTPTGGTISGLVTDDLGAPMGGASIQVTGMLASVVQTGPDGRYTATGLADGSYRVAVDAGHPVPPTFSPFAPHPELIDITAASTQVGVDFVLPRPSIVTGIVSDTNGVAIPNAVVSLSGNYNFITTGPDGRYVAAVQPGHQSISAAATGYVRPTYVGASNNTTQFDAVAGQVSTVDFALAAGGAVSGRVVDSAGVPVANANVFAQYSDPATGLFYSGGAASDSAGVYLIAALAPGNYIVGASTATTTTTYGTVAYFPGTADVNAAGLVAVVDGATTTSIDVPVPPAAPIGPPISVTSISPRVFVRGSTVQATLTGTGFVPGAAIQVTPFGAPPQPTASSGMAVDSTHATLTVATPADAPLGSNGGMYVSQAGRVADCNCSFFVVDTAAGYGTISGKVTLQSNGSAAANAVVTATPVGSPAGPFVHAATLADGTYQLAPLAAGDYLVKFSDFLVPSTASEYFPNAHTNVAATPVTVIGDADTANIDAALEAAVGAQITSVTPSVLAPGVTTDVVVTGTGFDIDTSPYLYSPTYSTTPPRAVSQTVVSDTELHLSIAVDALTPSGPLAISVFSRGPVSVGSCNCLSVDRTPPSTGVVAGSVADPAGLALGSVHVVATAVGQAQPSASTWTGGDGAYALRLPPGDYSLHFQDLAGGAGDVAPVTVSVGSSTVGANASFTPLASIGVLSGGVSGMLGQPLARAVVQVTEQSTQATTAMLTNAMGGYVFAALPAGTYTVEFIASGYQTRWFDGVGAAASATPVVVTGGAQTTVGATLPPSRRPLSLTSVAPSLVAPGETVTSATLAGSGFAYGAVTGLSLSAGDGVTITPVDASPDSTATVSIVVDPAAALGSRDVIATRDDGQVSICHGCLRVYSALGSMSGTVSFATAGGPTPAVMVTATSSTTGEIFRTTTAPGGAYSFGRLPVDTYAVEFGSPGYVSQWYLNADSAATATLVAVGPSPVTGIDGTLRPGRRSLYATMITPYALPQGSTTSVTIYGSGFLDGGVTNLSFGGGGGVMISVAGVMSDSTATAMVTVAADAALGFHSFAVSRDDGATYTCSNCFAVTLPPSRITGRVTDIGGAPVMFGSVAAYAVGGTFPVATAFFASDGSYSLDNLAAGNYQLQFSGYASGFFSAYSTQWWKNSPTQAKATPITVAAGQMVTGIDVQLTAPSSPLTLTTNPFSPYQAYQGTTHSFAVFGSGFLTGVTGLTYSAGSGVSVAVDGVLSDGLANVSVTADAGAVVGFRDLVVTRADGQTATCSLCLDVVPPPPGAISAAVVDADTGSFLFATINVTRLGDTSPSWSQLIFGGGFFASGLAPGDYDVSVTSFRHEPFTARVTVLPGQTTVMSEIRMVTIRQPLALTSPAQFSLYQGYTERFYMQGAGFRSGGVTGLTFSAGADVAVTVESITSDNFATLTLTPTATAAVGARDLTITRDDGEVVVCAGCVTISPPPPGSVSGYMYSADTSLYLVGTVTATRVGETTPAATTIAMGYYSLQGLAAGDYDLLFEAPGFTSSTQRVAVLPASETSTTVFLDMPRQTLTVTSVSPPIVDTGSYYALLVVGGSGFKAGGVSGLTASVGDGVVVQNLYALSDSLAYVYVSVDQAATIGLRDVVVGRDAGESATCGGCLAVRKAPGYVYGFLGSAPYGGYLFGTVTATRVGDTAPTATTTAFGYFSMQLPEGDYILKAEAADSVTAWWDQAAGEATATVVSVTSGGTTTGINFALAETRRPLAINYLTSNVVTQGQGTVGWAIGSGFLRAGVTGLTFSAGNGVTATIAAIYSDNEVLLTFNAADDAAVGARDVTATRDDGQVSVCTGCLTVLRGDPVVTSVSPVTVSEGKRTITISGTHLQKITKVTSSSRKVAVQSFSNNRDGSIAVRLKIDGAPRGTYVLTLVRDDGSTFTAEVVVTKR